MKIYLVGGAVRDELMGRIPKDKDYVVIGSSPEEMIALGYEQVGADFPVFLKNGEEYALARTERKSGKGYQGFTVDFDPTITLEDDLRRRDLTINAMAKDLETGEIIDPFNGLHDLQDRTLRHVSPAFAEDPLRVLRVARFCARYNFKIAHSTLELMSRLVQIGELDHLTPERVWVEIEKGLSEASPVTFIITLMVCEAWSKLFPGIRIGGTFHKLRNASDLSFNNKLMIIFSETEAKAVSTTLEKYKASADTMNLVMTFKHLQGSNNGPATPLETLQLLKRMDAFRRPENFYEIMKVACLYQDNFYLSLLTSFEIMEDVAFASLSPEQQSLKGADIGKAIDNERLKNLYVRIQNLVGHIEVDLNERLSPDNE